MAKQKYKFERLTPIDNMDLDVYEEAIDYVFSNSDVKNVAISGAYSAGKSSVLASYKKKHDELRFLHISLAHFKSTDQESDAEVKESTLEGKILNQLIHQIPSEKIPQTNFRVKKTVSSKSIATSTIGAVLFLISILHLLFFSVWKNYIGVLPVSLIKSILMPSTHPYALIVDGIIILVLLSLSVYKLIRIQREKNIFRKLNIKGNEIEIFEKSDDSYFDKYLNEVLYLFENSDADVIVFEDMDRFNTNGIFERLREVNTLANIQLNKENEKVLRFFYLLRDDIFDSKDRTKFFDYIIPVVPVVDSSNSYDQFISQLKSAGTFEKFDKSFLQGLSLYIDDMRLLKNIYNEFIIYYNRLNITELDCNKMLAIIAYKNLFPRDFADLQLNQGFVCTLFSKKDKFVENEVSEIKREIEEIRSKISSYKAEHLISMRELNVVFVLNNSDLTTEHKQAYIHSLETKITSIKAIKDSSLWAALLDANIVQYSECNIMDCFNAVKLNSSVVSYINQCDIDLDFSKTEYDENTKGALFDSVITCSDIGNSKYAQILSSLNFVYDDFDISGISDDKIAILIDKKIIRMTTDNLSFIRNNYPDQKFHFIHINMKEYVDTVGKTLFSQNELVEILTWDINDDLKISLLKMSKEPISIIGKGYSTAVCLHILSNNFAESDLPSLFSSFEQWDDSIQEKIFDHAVNNISCIIDNQDSIPTKLIKSLLNSESVSRDEKLDLFAAIMPGLCVDDIQSILILLNLTDYLKIFDMRSRPKFEINNESEKLLAAFKECHLIDSYEESTTKAGYYKVARPKATKALSKEPSTVT